MTSISSWNLLLFFIDGKILPDTAAKNSPAAGEGSDPASSGSDPASSPSPTKPEQLEDEEAAGEKDIVKECASPADSPTTANMLTMF